MRQLLPPGALGLLGLTAQTVFFLTLTLGLFTRAALLSCTLLGRRSRSLLTALFFLCALLGSSSLRLGLLAALRCSLGSINTYLDPHGNIVRSPLPIQRINLASDRFPTLPRLESSRIWQVHILPFRNGLGQAWH